MSPPVFTPARDAPFALLREMAEAPGLIRRFDPSRTGRWRAALSPAARILVTGEGSSRLFPAGNMIACARAAALPLVIDAGGAREAAEWPRQHDLVIALSNSGRTREAVDYARGHAVFAISGAADSPLAAAARENITLACGPEDAVAASKSVIEQALLLQSLTGPMPADALRKTADLAEDVLAAQLPAGAAEALAAAPTAYIAGRDDGVAAELALKCAEIARIKPLYLPGTYVLHGIEEVMHADDCVILVEPFAAEIDRYQKVLAAGVGLRVVAIAQEETPFPTFRLPACPGFDRYLQLMAGWRLLTAAGQLRGIDIDRTARARKVGNAVDAPA